jgi:hypothetical protein
MKWQVLFSKELGIHLRNNDYHKQNIGKLFTPSNAAVFVGSVVGNYSITLSYKGMSYAVKFASSA